MRNVFIWIALALALSPVCEAADVSFMGSKHGISMLLFLGPIQTGDLQKIEAAYEKAKPVEGAVVLMLSSKGGNVDEAMLIGDFVEQKGIDTLVPEEFGECISACVFILAAGDHKQIKGRVGIHRPYMTDVNIGGELGAKTLGQYLEIIKSYLDKKGIAPSLAEDMFSVPPEKVKYLTYDEASRYRLNQANYLKQEARDIDHAKSLGLTRQEYGALKNRLDRECAGMEYEKMMDCVRRITGTKLQ